MVIPQKLQSQVKAELLSGHFGSGHMKALARSNVWWPNMDDELKQKWQRGRCVSSTRMISPGQLYIRGRGLYTALATSTH